MRWINSGDEPGFYRNTDRGDIPDIKRRNGIRRQGWPAYWVCQDLENTRDCDVPRSEAENVCIICFSEDDCLEWHEDMWNQ